jgi:predicted phosphodiesterase
VEVIDAVRAQGWRVVLGNADAFLLDLEASSEPTTPRHLEMREWSLAQLGDERLDFIGTFSPTLEAALGGGRTLLAFHGSPGSFDDIILPSIDEESHRALLAGYDADVFAGGHVHVQWLRRLCASVYVNPGSVGLSYDHSQPEDDFRFDPWAAYALLETDEGGATEIALRRVPFDYREVIETLRTSDMPYAEPSIWRWEPRA